MLPGQQVRECTEGGRYRSVGGTKGLGLKTEVNPRRKWPECVATW